jgi:hypothetical protein
VDQEGYLHWFLKSKINFENIRVGV